MRRMPGVGLMMRVVGLGSKDPEFKSHSAVELIPGGVGSACHPPKVGKMSASLLVSCVRVATRPGLFSTHLSSQCRPSSLLDLTIGFVASHLQLLDSLRGFPEQLGSRIFSTAVSGGFLDPRDPASPCVLRVFGEAYGDAVLDSLKRFFTRIAMLRLLLNMHASGFLYHVRTPPNAQLQVLSLASNELTDAGMRILTGATRVGLRGLASLHTLNLAGMFYISFLKQYLT
uniref:Uncharacterized protein n=1 Tax=Eptatretus burgeri TaxID=7764 RepID=A0A8C4QEY6_EPTBU